jgi:hypothetical protein
MGLNVGSYSKLELQLNDRGIHPQQSMLVQEHLDSSVGVRCAPAGEPSTEARERQPCHNIGSIRHTEMNGHQIVQQSRKMEVAYPW